MNEGVVQLANILRAQRVACREDLLEELESAIRRIAVPYEEQQNYLRMFAILKHEVYK